jgi:hypothetical protein
VHGAKVERHGVVAEELVGDPAADPESPRTFEKREVVFESDPSGCACGSRDRRAPA